MMSACVWFREALAAAIKVNHAPTAAQIVKTADQNIVEVKMSGSCFMFLLPRLLRSKMRQTLKTEGCRAYANPTPTVEKDALPKNVRDLGNNRSFELVFGLVFRQLESAEWGNQLAHTHPFAAAISAF